MNLKQKNKSGRPGITVSDVARAYQALREQGRPIGPVNIRLELGRGSFSTIVRGMRELGLASSRSPRKTRSP